MSRWFSLSTWLLTTQGLFAAGFSLARIATTEEQTLIRPSTPIVGDGVAYWQSRGSSAPDGGGERLFSFPGGTIASDLRTESEEGDFPVGVPLDAAGGKLLVSGRYYQPTPPQGFLIHNTLVEYPGGRRLLYPFSKFPDGIAGSPDLSIGGGLYDADGSIVFSLRQVQGLSVVFTALGRLSGGTVSILVRTGVDAVPGTTTPFASLGRYSTHGGVTIFYGQGGDRRGIYQLSASGLSKVLEDGDPAPDGGGGILSIRDDSLLSLANEGSDLVIANADSGGWIYKRVQGTWSLVARAGTPIPGGVGNFLSLSSPAIHDGAVMFFGGRNNIFLPPLQLGLYVETSNGLKPVVDLGADFGGLNVAFLQVPASGGRYWDGEKVVFNVANATRDRYALYMASPGLRIGSFELVGLTGSGRLQFPSEAGVSYRVEQSTNCVTWSTAKTVSGTGSTITVEGLPSDGLRRFFRLATP
ncbi:MAG: hypothetical protein JNL10_05665 [Verrucomicrobiales bacterium]|nr:hypothetical protein [Verrucomicrobiales bacterium]